METGERELGKAVILQAISDANAERDSLDRKEARLFLCAKNKLWAESLSNWCYIAGWDEDYIKKYARERWLTK